MFRGQLILLRAIAEDDLLARQVCGAMEAIFFRKWSERKDEATCLRNVEPDKPSSHSTLAGINRFTVKPQIEILNQKLNISDLDLTSRCGQVSDAASPDRTPAGDTEIVD